MKPFWKHVPDEMERHILAKAQRSAYLFLIGFSIPCLLGNLVLRKVLILDEEIIEK